MTGSSHYDYVIIGAGMGGLTVGALLAHRGARVAVVEAHEYPGGYCHTFPMGDYRFCAAVHYIFSCGEGEPVYNLLRKLGLHEAITFERLNPEGYDHFSCPSANLRFRIPSGLTKWGERLCDRFPNEASQIRSFFHTINTLALQLDNVPGRLGPFEIARSLLAHPQLVQLIRYRGYTLQRLYDDYRLSTQVQAIVSAQVGDVGLPPNQVSLLIWVALIARYSDGAYYPTEHFSSLVDGLAETISQKPGCLLSLKTEITSARLENGRLAAVISSDGREFRGDRFICNADPQWFVSMVGQQHFPSQYLKKVKTEYSAASVSIYLGVKDIDLRDYGFGNWNVWHYPHLNINEVYEAQHQRNDLSDPWLFMSTPTLCSPNAKSKHAPSGEQILELITTCAYEPFEAKKATNVREYTARKNEVRNRMLEVVEANYVPKLRKHLAMRVTGTPTTNRRYVWAPRGNIYGSALTPQNVDASRLGPKSPIDNLFFTGASAAFPSVGGTVSGGERLYTELTGDMVNPARDR